MGGIGSAGTDSTGGWPASSFLGSLEGPPLQHVLRLGVKRQFPGPDHVLIREGFTTNAVYLLLTGIVKITCATEESSALIAIRTGGDVVGEMAALDGLPRSATVTTAGPVIARVISQGEFIAVLRRDPEMALVLNKSVSEKLRETTTRLVDFGSCPASVRVARILLELSVHCGIDRPHGRVIDCPLTQTELATLAGSTEPTAQRALRQLRASGVVASGYRETTILDLDGLRRAAYPPSLAGRRANCAEAVS